MPWFQYPDVSFRGKVFQKTSTKTYDVILVSGDAYVDHPSFPAAVITRYLQSLHLNVAVITQPDWTSTSDFMVFGRPALFFGVTSGAMDSMVANYTSMKMPRSEDRMSPGGKSGLRPKRAVNVYSQLLRQAFPGIPIILGGIEASLRRFSHYDFWENKVKDSVLADSGADMIVYGMGENPLRDIVQLFQKHSWKELKDIPVPQTCVKRPPGSSSEIFGEKMVLLPDAKECRQNPLAIMQLSQIMDLWYSHNSLPMVQRHEKFDFVCFPPSSDRFSLEWGANNHKVFNRRAHPIYEEPVPAVEPVQFSIISHRGCFGTCSFCSIALHQGREVISRPIESIVKELASFKDHPDFHGVVPDIGGPSANMYGWSCESGGCEKKLCTFPGRCKNLKGNLAPTVELLKAALQVPGIRKVFIGSGLRFDLIEREDLNSFTYIIANHVSGQLKVAPEHVSRKVLRLMRKAPDKKFAEFVEWYYEIVKRLNKKFYLIPYFMTAFPGADELDSELEKFISQYRLAHEQIQEFTPTPGTIATAMYWSETDFMGNKISVAKSSEKRRNARRNIQKNGRV
ncbi:MAG: YgiQ family radical SAM protein [Candidatus Riflebacteria bacterium]|nr:YgiQ family radical SAM protein [Candidatus Riflebacteria bacterium]